MREGREDIGKQLAGKNKIEGQSHVSLSFISVTLRTGQLTRRGWPGAMVNYPRSVISRCWEGQVGNISHMFFFHYSS